MNRRYDRRFQSVRGYEALLRSMSKPGPSDHTDDQPDLDSEIRKSLAAKMSEPSAVWVLDGRERSPEKTDDVMSVRPSNDERDESCGRQSEHERDESAALSFTQIERAAGTRIHDWSSIRHVELVHRQGLHAPALIVDYLESQRPYYQASYVDSDNKPVPVLYVRRKRNRLKFRISSNHGHMHKFRNPHYVGKCTVRTSNADRMICAICSKSSEAIGIITITSKAGKHHVRVELTGQLLNWEENGADGLVMSGYINNYLDPILLLRVDQSNRAVLEIRKSGPLIPAPNEAFDHQPHAMVYSDYPLTLFLSTVICVMVDSRRRGLGTPAK